MRERAQAGGGGVGEGKADALLSCTPHHSGGWAQGLPDPDLSQRQPQACVAPKLPQDTPGLRHFSLFPATISFAAF